MAISFNNIPSNIRVPLFYAEVDNSQASFFQRQNSSLLIGQKLSGGTATANKHYLVTSVDQAKSLFGVGSMLARMVELYKKNDDFTELWCLPLDDNGAGTAATGSLTITGTATKAGTLNVYVAGQRVQVAVASGDTANTVGVALAAAIAALTSLPVTGSNSNGVVTLTARHKGEMGNDVDVRVNYLGELGGEITPAGLSTSVVAMNSGASNPSLTNAIAAMGDKEFDAIILPYTDTTSLDALKVEMNEATGRWSYARQIYGHVWSAKRGSVGGLGTFGNSRNDPHATVVGYNDSPTPSYEWASAYGAQAAKALAIDPARPLQTLPLVGVSPPPVSSRFTLTERQTLLFDGIATWVFNGGEVRIERAITTYQLNTFSEPDPSYLDATTLYTLAAVIRRLRSRITQKFPRHKLANDGTRFGDGQAIVTPNIIRAELVSVYSEMENQGLVENIEAFKAALIVERNANDPNRVDVLYPPDLVNQLRVLAILAQFRLQFNQQTLEVA